MHLAQYLSILCRMQRLFFISLLLSLSILSFAKKEVTRPLTRTFSVCGVEFNMVRVDEGVFQMGGTREQRSDKLSTDKPVHTVLLDTYYIGATEVTRRLWKAVMGDTLVAGNEWLAEDLPQEWVSWYDCQRFLQRLDSLTGAHFRLPTEAEWEFAARGGRQAEDHRFSGSDEIDEVGWVYRNSGSRTHPVAAKQPNQLGIYDMTGNVWEWCSDRFGLYGDTLQVNPIGAAEGDMRVVRGGSWDNAVDNVNLSVRQSRDPQYTFYDCGFRLALSEEKPPIVEVLPEEKRVHVRGHNLRFRLVTSDSIAPYYIAETEVTQSLWRSMMHNNPSHKKRPTYPVESVSWTDCRIFINKLNKRTGLRFRLPTVAEWQYAAQGGQHSILYERLDGKVDSAQIAANRPKYVPANQRKATSKANQYLGMIALPIPFTHIVWSPTLPEYDDAILYDYKMAKQDTAAYVYSGSDIADNVAWHYGNSKSREHRVRFKKPNELGLYDMSGNVAEWTEDRTVNGGSWFDHEDHCRSVDSKPMAPSMSTPYVGLRLVLDPEPQKRK